MTQNIAQLFKKVRTTEEAVAECCDEAEPDGIVALEDLEPPPAALQRITSDDLDHEHQIDSVDADGESSMPSIHVSPPIVPVHTSTAEQTITEITKFVKLHPRRLQIANTLH